MGKTVKKQIQVLEYQLPIRIEPQEEDGYVATCPLWQACYAQGETVEEVVSEITAVAASLIDLYKEEGLKIPLKVKKERTLSSKQLLQIPVILSP